MLDQESFIRTILESPGDDGPRLVFADWLEEHGECDRAEFIRLQFQAEQLQSGAPERRLLRAHEDDLIQRYGSAWFGLVPDWQRDKEFTVRRGFVESLVIASDVLEAVAHRIMARSPVTHLKVSNSGRSLSSLRSLLNNPALTGVRHLDLSFGWVGSDGARMLADYPSLANLRSLSVGCMGLKNEGIRILAQAPNLANLESADIRHNDLDSQGLQQWIASPYRKKMRRLCLCGNRHSIEGVLDLLHSPGWPALTDLCIWNTNLNDEGLIILAADPGLTRITRLNSNKNRITDRGIAALGKSPHSKNLRSLFLAFNEVTREGVHDLADRLPELDELNIHDNRPLHQSQRRDLPPWPKAATFDREHALRG